MPCCVSQLNDTCDLLMKCTQRISLVTGRGFHEVYTRSIEHVQNLGNLNGRVLVLSYTNNKKIKHNEKRLEFPGGGGGGHL